MGTAIVPVWPRDTDIINDIKMRPRVQTMYRARKFANVARAFMESFTPALQKAVDAFNAMGAALTRIGVLPPDPTQLKHGTVWVSPLDGNRLRVRGRRGRPQTFHWGRP